jgi:hypothetical protein
MQNLLERLGLVKKAFLSTALKDRLGEIFFGQPKKDKIDLAMTPKTIADLENLDQAKTSWGNMTLSGIYPVAGVAHDIYKDISSKGAFPLRSIYKGIPTLLGLAGDAYIWNLFGSTKSPLERRGGVFGHLGAAIGSSAYNNKIEELKKKLLHERRLEAIQEYHNGFPKTAEVNNKHINFLLQTIFGRNAIPRPVNGDMHDALIAQQREITSRGLAHEQFKNNPLLQRLNLNKGLVGDALGFAATIPGSRLSSAVSPLVGGDASKAVSHLYNNMQNANVMGAFGRTHGLSGTEANAAIEAAKKQFYRSEPSEADGNAKTSSEKLPGGKGDNKPDSKYNKKELAKGVAHEKEHTTDETVAKEIAKDHLEEMNDYYSAMERAKLAKLNKLNNK